MPGLPGNRTAPATGRSPRHGVLVAVGLVALAAAGCTGGTSTPAPPAATSTAATASAPAAASDSPTPSAGHTSEPPPSSSPTRTIPPSPSATPRAPGVALTTLPDGNGISVRYPRVSGIATATAVNARIRATVDAIVTSFRSDARGQTPPPGIPGSTLTVRTTSLWATPRWLSFQLFGDQYVAGAAHPSYVGEGVTIDLATGRRLALDDLFAVPPSRYLPGLTRLAREQLAAQNPAFVQPGMGPWYGPQAESFRVWSVDAGRLRVTFLDAPTVFGAPKVAIRAAAVAALVSASGPLHVG